LFGKLLANGPPSDPGLAIEVIPGVGPVLAAVFAAESATSFASPGPSSWPRGPD
jgi:hypothetical protein